jgi:hypothetical protein
VGREDILECEDSNYLEECASNQDFGVRNGRSGRATYIWKGFAAEASASNIGYRRAFLGLSCGGPGLL